MKRISLFVLGIMLFGLFSVNVKADSITYQRLNNIYFNLTVDGVKSSNHVTAFYLDGRLAYCIEPGTSINTRNYDAYPSWYGYNLTDEQKDQIEKIGYYGYEYPGHQTDRYYIAAQELIWKTVKNVDIYWTDSNNNIIDITSEKEEINNLIKIHNTYPSFTNDIITGQLDSVITITDTNNVLENFTISDSVYHKIEIKDNSLEITFNSELVEEETILLTRKMYDQKTLLVYRYPGSQSLAALRLSMNENLSFKLKNAEKPKEIVKVPSTDVSKQFGILKIKDVKFN